MSTSSFLTELFDPAVDLSGSSTQHQVKYLIVVVFDLSSLTKVLLTMYVNKIQGCPRGVMVKSMDCGIVVRNQTNKIHKKNGWKPASFPSQNISSQHFCLYISPIIWFNTQRKDGANTSGIWSPKRNCYS